MQIWIGTTRAKQKKKHTHKDRKIHFQRHMPIYPIVEGERTKACCRCATACSPGTDAIPGKLMLVAMNALFCPLICIYPSF